MQPEAVGRDVTVDDDSDYVTFHKLNVRIKIKKIIKERGWLGGSSSPFGLFICLVLSVTNPKTPRMMPP